MMTSNYTIELDNTVSFNLKGSGGLLLIGRSGTGKSNLATYIMLKSMSQVHCGLYIVDAKRADMFGLSKVLINGNKVVVSTTNQIARMLRLINENMNNRYEHFNNGKWGQDFSEYGFRPYLLVIDEISAMLAEAGDNKKEIVSQLRQIILRGRQAGIFTLISGQRIDASILDRDITLQLGTRIVMGQADSDTYRMAYPMIKDIKSLPFVPNQPGYGLIYSDGQRINNPIPFISADMTNIDVPDVIRRLEQTNAKSDYVDESSYWKF
ncbi:cell division protein FtsK [Lactobacillus johnsonii]|nr:AAA family ATPase [Lactobacillus johnsonii]PAB50507.1 cell division protein FtsK [Lactobacillus johnsonii]PAB54332.1 cell division protein FtsK [Lactobacillus johnsonii]PEG69372.1 cell division protein FtsK [Lactobacillus johnsonii]